MRMLCKILPVMMALLLASCASVSVYDSQKDAHTPKAVLPGKIYVRSFQDEGHAFHVDRSGPQLEEMKTSFSNLLRDAIVVRVNKHIAPAEAVSSTSALPRGSAWLVTGKFVRVNQGSRALRAFIGWGAGATKLNASVEVFDLSTPVPRRFIAFRTTGGSNAQPGMLTAPPDPIGTPMAGLSQAVGTGLSIDAKRTARMVTAALCEYLDSRGVPVPKPIRPKPLGTLPGKKKIF